MALQIHNKSAQTNDILDAINYSKGTQRNSVKCYFITILPIIINWSDTYQTDPGTYYIFLNIQLNQNRYNSTEFYTIHTE